FSASENQRAGALGPVQRYGAIPSMTTASPLKALLYSTESLLLKPRNTESIRVLISGSGSFGIEMGCAAISFSCCRVVNRLPCEARGGYSKIALSLPTGVGQA